ncbi:LacI family DNA-binding transcriptional regulator [Occultella gossypii]|uniref:LacI family DNA-binding transcriptional regulator n=1 Tax=Occultella gossypii TaxID=2800820 RepID=A0ABS7SDH4_9MICO|nr:LacI family DNA-binding transcriptional regulator [Occultella gossypii]MBZ2198117.1 LacI family DNA-binding transcriptional regulator [Occultella gossypii]
MSQSASGTRRPTIREVARLAGVSHQTVSRFLHDDPRISEQSQARIRTAIEQLDYRPNLVARAMRGHKTGRLAFILPTGTTVSSLEILAGATTAAHDAGFILDVVTLGGPVAQRAGRVDDLAESGLFEGIASLMPLPESRRPQDRTPIVISPEYDDQMRSIGELADAAPVAELIEHLADLGHRRFVHLAGDYAHTSARRRRDMYLATIERLGLHSHGVIDCDWRAERAEKAMLDLPAHAATAVITGNDVVAAGALRGAFARGWRVPEDVSITGWDNNKLGAVLPPTITTVIMDHERVGRRAITRLLAALNGEPDPVDNEPIGTVVWRESTGPAPS